MAHISAHRDTGIRSRRPKGAVRALAATLAILTVAATTGCSLVGSASGIVVDTRGKSDFPNALQIPPLDEGTVDADGTRVFDLTAAAGETRFLPGAKTRTWGFDGSYLGPTLRAAVGEKVTVHVENDLDQATSVHWHGMHLPAAMDGGPHQEVAANGGVWDPHWTIDQPAATLWYHPHPHGETERHVFNGLAGMFILDDPAVAPADLPTNYGVDDVPVIVQDRDFDQDNQFEFGDRSETGMLGDTILVNGTVTPHLDVTTERVRLRLLNASTARIYTFGLSDARPFQLIASDGGLLSSPYSTDGIRLAPGERAEIVVTVAEGEEVSLQSTKSDLGTSVDWAYGGDDSFDILQLRTAAQLAPSPAVPDALATIPSLAGGPIATTRQFVLSGRKINDKSMAMNRIDFAATVDTTEVWEVKNDNGFPHDFHVHDVQFQVLSVGGAAPPPELAGWKDTVYLPPHVAYRLIMRFEDYTSTTSPYMFHCHLLWHEDEGMMGQFVVVKPGEAPVDPPKAPEGHNH